MGEPHIWLDFHISFWGTRLTPYQLPSLCPAPQIPKALDEAWEFPISNKNRDKGMDMKTFKEELTKFMVIECIG